MTPNKPTTLTKTVNGKKYISYGVNPADDYNPVWEEVKPTTLRESWKEFTKSNRNGLQLIIDDDLIADWWLEKLTSHNTELISKIEGISLDAKQSTKIFAKILERMEAMKSNWTYKAPEVIEQEMKEFVWSVYISGRVDEKDEVISIINQDKYDN